MTAGAFAQACDEARSDPEAFWLRAAEAISWRRPPAQALRFDGEATWSWFEGAELNTCENALDRHVEAGRGEQAALIYDSPVTGTIRRIGYRELRDEVALFAGALRGLGVTRGDRVVIYLPMVPEAVIAMLACARLGAVHSVVFGGFAARELALRIDDAEPRVVVTASCGIEPARVVEYVPLVEAALRAASHRPDALVLLQRTELRAELAGAHDWHELMRSATPAAPVAVRAEDPLYILYTSGTTGKPKGIVRDNGGHAVALAWSMPNVYDTRAGDVFWSASDIGWVVGHSYIVYAPLLVGATSVLYEGKPVGTPDAGAFWRVIAEHGVQTFFTAPTAIRAIKRDDADGELVHKHRPVTLRSLFLAGERLDPDTWRWAGALLGVPVIDHWWQTETGWPIAGNPIGLEQLPMKPGSPTAALPGWDVRALAEDGRELAAGEEGAIAIRLPLPPGAAVTIWRDRERYERSYLRQFPGWYATGDGGLTDADGFLYVMGRIDDVINVAGHRLSTGAMEEALSTHPLVAETAVVGRADALKGQVPIGFVVLKAVDGERDLQQIREELVAIVRERIGPVAAFRQVHVVARLPKTRSGKVLRSTMRKLIDGAAWDLPPTIEDPAALDEIAAALSAPT